MNLPHLCFVANHIYPVLVRDSGISFVGGAEVQQSVQMRALQRAGYRISVLVKDYGQADVVDCDGIRLHRIPDPGQRGVPLLRFVYPRLTDILGLLRRIEPDIVFMQTAGEQVFGAALYARLSGARFVFAGASDMDFVRGPLPGMPAQHSFMYRLGLRAAHAVIVQNLAQQRMLKEHFGREGHLIQNGYEEAAARPGSFQGHVLWAATVKPLKRPDLFIELARRTPGRRFVMVGGPGITPDAQAYFAEMAERASGVPNLEMKGHVPYHQVGAWFDGAALSVNTSDYEGLPNTFLQAWLRGIPSLSFVCPESAPGETGTLACRDLDDMAARVGALCADEAAWRMASAACRRHFDAHHRIDAVVDRYRAVFDEVLAVAQSASVPVSP